MTGAAVHMAPLRLFWWRGVPNFGDAISRTVTAYLAGRDVVHAGPKEAELIGLGSILQILRRACANGKVTQRPVVWGSGVLHFIPKDFLEKVEVALLRGPITAALLGIKAREFGDPGLLVADAMAARPERQDRIALVPHYSQIDDPVIRALSAADPVYDLIDPRGEAAEVVARIASSRHVVASSLHGLITADAYGVPSTWADPGAQAHLKYHDYAASVGRSMIAPISWHEVPELRLGAEDAAVLPHAEGIERAQEALRASFPLKLKRADQA